jgi:hypothetical protein
VRKLFFCAACLALSLGTALSQDCKKADYSADQQKYMDAALQKFAACPLPLDASCRAALAEAMEHVYGVKDFGAESKYMTPPEIGKRVAADSNWEHVGSASDQNALKSAQSSANCGKAVLAVLASDTGGHVAMILPGPLAHSGVWKLDVPNSASFFTHNPSKSFAGKPLSYSFPNPQNIEIYARKN